MASSYADKLALFRARFACRGDAWAKRWTSRNTGRSGFAPACGNEWRPGFCPKPSKGCSACRNRAWIPLSDETIRWHLLGATPSGKPFALGGYPILVGDDCRLAALHCPADRADARSPDMRRPYLAAPPLAMDKAEQRSLRSLREIQRIASAMGAPPTITSALSGDGFVLWWFFVSPVPAGLARSLVSACLTAARRAGAEIPFSAWDGILPEQATLPVTGPGVPVPLPLQGEARRRGLGVPLDPATLAPAPDPWVALSAAPVLDPPRAGRIVEAARGRLYPVASVDRDYCSMLNDECRMMNERNKSIHHSSFIIHHSRIRVRGVLSDRLRIPLAELPPGAAAALEETAAFLSPVFEDAERTRRPVRGIPRIESHARIEAMPIDRKAAVQSRLIPGADLSDLDVAREFVRYFRTYPGEEPPKRLHESSPASTYAWFLANLVGQTFRICHRSFLVKPGHYFRFVCETPKEKGKRKGWIDTAGSPEEARRLIETGAVTGNDIAGFVPARAASLPFVVHVLTRPDAILKKDYKILVLKKFRTGNKNSDVAVFLLNEDGTTLGLETMHTREVGISFVNGSTLVSFGNEGAVSPSVDLAHDGLSPTGDARDTPAGTQEIQASSLMEVKSESSMVSTTA